MAFHPPGDLCVSSSPFDSVGTQERKHLSVLPQERRKQAVLLQSAAELCRWVVEPLKWLLKAPEGCELPHH